MRSIKLLSQDRAKEATNLLNSWAETLLNLETKYHIKKNEISNRDYSFLKLIGQTVYSINSFNSLIIGDIESHIHRRQNAQSDPDLANSVFYNRFFNSLVASKIKYFFFREIPIINTNNPFLDLDLVIYNSAKYILSCFADYKGFTDRLKANLCKYFYLQTLLYSFIYDKQKEKGAFLRFKYNKSIFEDLEKKITRDIASIQKEEELRLFGSSFISEIARYYIEKHNHGKGESCREKEILYRNLFQLQADDPDFYVEPMIYHLSDIIWKVDGMIQDDSEFFDENDKHHNDLEIINIIKTFVKDYLNISLKMYNANKLDYITLYELENEFIIKIYDMLLRQKDVIEITAKFNALEELVAKNVAKTSPKIIDEKFNNGSTIRNALNKLRTQNEYGFKLESLIENLTKEDLLALLILYCRTFRADILTNEKTAFVGFYKSGVFLGHLVNIVHKLHKPVWLFRCKPYVATHPIHRDGEIDFHRIILFDESFKTGFTHSLYESYLVRNLPSASISTYLYCLFDFLFYDKITLSSHCSFSSLVKLNDNFIPVNKDELDFLITVNHEDHIDLPDVEELSMEEVISELMKHSSDHGRLDLTMLLSKTKILFCLCNRFKELIIKHNYDNKQVLIISPSADGEILALVTAFLLKMDGRDVAFYRDIASLTGDKMIVAVDLIIETGFSLAYYWAMLSKGCFDSTNMNCLLDELDLVCAIAGRKRGLKNAEILYVLPPSQSNMP